MRPDISRWHGEDRWRANRSTLRSPTRESSHRNATINRSFDDGPRLSDWLSFFFLFISPSFPFYIHVFRLLYFKFISFPFSTVWKNRNSDVRVAPAVAAARNEFSFLFLNWNALLIKHLGLLLMLLLLQALVLLLLRNWSRVREWIKMRSRWASYGWKATENK